jgi:hypothetical protein
VRIDVITLFPEFMAQSAALGVVGRAAERGLLDLHGWNPRDYAEGNYRRVDDRPFGGGPGMVMLIEPLLVPPAGDLRVVAGKQHVGHVLPAPDFRPRVVRPVEQAADEGLVGRRFFLQRAGQLAHEGVDQRHRRDFAAGQHEVADRNVFVDARIEKALVDAFVAAADEDQAERGLRRKFAHARIGQARAGRRQGNHARRRAAGRALRRPRPLDGLCKRFGKHHHARATAERPVVHGAMVVRGEVARIEGGELPQALRQRAPGDAVTGDRLEHLRK